MSILSGFIKTIKYRLTADGYKWQSEKTSSQTVVMGNGTDDTDTLESRLGTIKGITSSLSSTSANYALSASAGKSLQDQTTTNTNNISTLNTNLTTHKTSSDHDSRYYTKTQTDDFFKSSFDTVTSKVNISYTKRAGFVFAMCQEAPSSEIPANIWTVIATMPSGYRPAYNVPFVGNYGSLTFIGYFYTNGNIVIYPTQELPTGGNGICFNISYPVA